MAQIQSVTLVDDLDGTPADRTIEFGIFGVVYEVDVHSEHYNALVEATQPFVAKARRIGKWKQQKRVAPTKVEMPAGARLKRVEAPAGDTAPKETAAPEAAAEAKPEAKAKPEPRRTTIAASGTGLPKGFRDKVRVWGIEQGLMKGERGRVPAKVFDAYLAEHGLDDAKSRGKATAEPVAEAPAEDKISA